MPKHVIINPTEGGTSSGNALSRGVGLVVHQGLSSGAALSSGDTGGLIMNGAGGLAASLIQQGQRATVVLTGSGNVQASYH